MVARRQIVVVGGLDSLECTTCKEVKKLKAFNKREPYADGTPRFRSDCKGCAGKKGLSHYHENRKGLVHRKTSYRYTLKTLYGLTEDGFNHMYDKAKGRCEICHVVLANVFKTLEGTVAAVDHCHDTGAVRGLLCRNCNSGIGLLKDDPILLKKGMEYLDGFISR